MELTYALLKTLCRNGYTDVMLIDNRICALQRFIYTVGLCIDLDATGYRGRFCFDDYLCAKLFLREWDGFTLPVVGEDGCTAIKISDGLRADLEDSAEKAEASS